MKPYQKRLVEEYKHIKKEELKLFNYILKRELGLSKTLPRSPMNVLKKQYEAMHDYSKILALRIEMEQIDFDI